MNVDQETTLPDAPDRPSLKARRIACGRALVVGGVLVLTALFLFRFGREIQEEALTGVCQSRLKYLSLAIHNYHHDFGCFPPAYVPDEHGNPMHSWRVLILPYLELGDVYEQYDFSQPWNSPDNMALARSHPEILDVFQCTYDGNRDTGWTSYVAIVGQETVWPGAKSLDGEEVFSDREAILLTEVKQSGIHWMEPRDLSYEEATQGLIESSPHSGFVHFSRVDGSVDSLARSGFGSAAEEAHFIERWARRDRARASDAR